MEATKKIKKTLEELKAIELEKIEKSKKKLKELEKKVLEERNKKLLYEFKDLDDFKKVMLICLILYKSKLEHTELHIENVLLNVKVKDGVLDTENKTISFPETPRIDDLYLLGIYTDKRELNPVTYNYKLENNELILTVSGENR